MLPAKEEEMVQGKDNLSEIPRRLGRPPLSEESVGWKILLYAGKSEYPTVPDCLIG